ncbi:hypothetical protein IWQ57_004582 [Coemansia nantahalensis]|uniref:Uncharacterized protein n=1 Tax=Coemansia nantahalensis TaxID=2789366 RepID=A0ACC1JRT4_9FUNG|nr:hypothetical protein IWQ57_004582 [Coemansia nantahalensis]
MVPKHVLHDTSAYKYAVFDLDGLQADAYAPKGIHGDDYATLRALLPAERCCYAVYNLAFIRNMRPVAATIFYTWLPSAAPLDERQRYLLEADAAAAQLSHYDLKITSAQTSDFQQLAATHKARALLRRRRPRSLQP